MQYRVQNFIFVHQILIVVKNTATFLLICLIQPLKTYVTLFVPWVIFRIVIMWFRGIINIQYEFSFPFEELWQVDLR